MMGKNGGGSWLSAVKKAFRSPTKDNEKKVISRRREETEQEEEEKKRGKRRWVFRKSLLSCETTIVHHNEPTKMCCSLEKKKNVENDEQRSAIAVAMATAAAAKAAAATAQAAAEIIRLTRPSILDTRQRSAVIIQAAFRGYLARKALKALKGVVKLQALVRGHIVRKRAKMTLQCMQALLRVQARVCDQRKKVSCHRNLGSMANNTKCISESYLTPTRKSTSRNGNYSSDEGDECQQRFKMQSILQNRKEANLKREVALAYAFSKQIWSPPVEQLSSGIDENISSSSYDQRENAKIVEIDTFQPYTHSPSNFQKTRNLRLHDHQNQPYSPSSVSSPWTEKCLVQSARTIHGHSDTPRWPRKDQNIITSHTPTLRGSAYCHRASLTGNSAPGALPNYMVATASANARRSYSAPRQRASTPEREKIKRTELSAKKRLSFPDPDRCSEGGISDFDLDHTSCDEISSTPLRDERRWLR